MTSAVRRSARISTNQAAASITQEASIPKPAVTKTTKKSTASKSKSKTKEPAPTRKKRKGTSTSATTTAPDNDNNDDAPPAPPESTTITTIPPLNPPQTPLPKSKRQKPSSTSTTSDSPLKPLPPFTPTPSAISLLSNTNPKKSESNHPLEDLGLKPRPAQPHATNAPLSTPGGSRVVAYTSSPIKPPSSSQNDQDEPPSASPTKSRKAKETVPPDVGALPHPTSTIDTLLKDACEHLCSVDPKLRGLIEKHHCAMFSPEGLREVVEPFTALASGIIGQQVSGQAASSIRAKFTSLFPSTHPSFPTPTQILTKDIPTLRTAGLSQRKAEYIHGLAEKFSSGELSASILISASDEELIERLVAVRGLGRWSVEMFACFGLKRMDVFSTGDLGVQRGIAIYTGKDVSKLKSKGGKWKYMTEKEMLDIAARFSPYRSLFMWYMWRISDVDISVLQE